MGSIALEECELMRDSKYRTYVAAVDKALKNFEYTSEWADLISALGKLNKVLLSNLKFPVIPRKIIISKRLAQCMHPALPSGVHLKALETYDVIFKCMGTNRLSHELFIYSAGLFPLLGNAAMNVRPSLLTVYENHFVPLGERLTPGLSGFLSGVLPGLEEGSDHFDRTNLLLEKVCDGVGPIMFYACLWDCVSSNPCIRLPALSFVLSHFNKKLLMKKQLYIMGTNIDNMVIALCRCIQDTSALVQRSALDLLLAGFPIHDSQFEHNDMIKLLTSALATILRRDMSLNRRLFNWLLGSEVNTSILKSSSSSSSSANDLQQHNVTLKTTTTATYFDTYSKIMLIEAMRETLKIVCNENPLDLKPYRILVSLLDKLDIGPVILDDILYEVFRTFYNACSQTEVRCLKSHEVVKSANLLFSTLQPSYIWLHCSQLYKNSCNMKINNNNNNDNIKLLDKVAAVGSGMPNLMEICILAEFLLDTVSVDAFIDTSSEHLPDLFHDIINTLSSKLNLFTPMEITKSLDLCSKILSKVQPIISPSSQTIITNNKNDESSFHHNHHRNHVAINNNNNNNNNNVNLTIIPLEKSQSDSKLNKQIKMINTLSESPSSSPSPRRRANSGGASKKNDKKTKKKSSKSASKLNELCEISADDTISSSSNNNNNDDDDDESLKTKSIDDSVVNYDATCNIKFDINNSNNSNNSSPIKINNNRTPSPAQQAQHSMLENCLRQYENFYVKLVSERILENEKSISEMFDELIICPKENLDERTKQLEEILNSTLKNNNNCDWTCKVDLSFVDKKKYSTKIKNHNNQQPYNYFINSINQNNWEGVLKIASSLLVELSTFPTYCQSGDEYYNIENNNNNNNKNDKLLLLPDWLRVLTVCSCWLGKQPSLQLISISTLLDLMELSSAHNNNNNNNNNNNSSSCQYQNQNIEQGIITTVVMIPLMKKWHITYLSQCTNVYQTLAYSLWNHLGQLPAYKYRLKCVELLHELHHSLYLYCDAVEDIIGMALTTTSIEIKIDAFHRFSTLWHLGREIQTNPRLRGCSRTFDKSLFKMLDNLQLVDNSPLKIIAQSWLLHSLVRGDISRIVDPVLSMLLDPSTCRMSVLHVSIQHSNTVLTKHDNNIETIKHLNNNNNNDNNDNDDEDDSEGTAKIYAISSVDGNVIYHVSDTADVNNNNNNNNNNKNKNKRKKKKLINPVKVKRIFAVTTLANTQKGNQYVTEKNQFMKELEVPSSISENRNISVFVNPLSNTNTNSSDSLTFDAVDTKNNSSLSAELFKNAMRFKKPDNDKEGGGGSSSGSFDESLFESNNSISESTITNKDYENDNDNYNDDDDDDNDKNNNNDDDDDGDYLKKSNKKNLESSIDSISNSENKSIINKSPLSILKKEPIGIIAGGSREVAGTLLKGKYHSTNEFSSYDINESMMGNNYDDGIGVPSWTMGDEDCDIDLSTTTAEEYFGNKNGMSIVEQVLNEVVDKVHEMCQYIEPKKESNNKIHDTNNTNNNKNKKIKNYSSGGGGGVGVHNLHSHMLLYCGVYDSTRTLYALRTLKNELITNARMFLFAAATTGITSASKNSTILTLLARHRKSVLGRNFYGDVASTKFIATYRSSMYLEVLITICLYLMRSYYPNLGQMRLTQEEISGNRQVQLASAELLTLIFSELITIVRDSGKGFSCYIMDLLTKCIVQKIALHCLVSSVLNMKNLQNDNHHVFTFTEEIILFNDPIIDENDLNKCKYRASIHTEAFQIQLLRLILSLIMLEHQCGLQNSVGTATAATTNTTSSNTVAVALSTDDTVPPPTITTTSSSSSQATTPTATAATAATTTQSSSSSRNNNNSNSNLFENSLEYISGASITQQPMFLASILSALQLKHLRHLHQHWTNLVTSSLPYMGISLTKIVTSVIHQLCCNIEYLAAYYVNENDISVDNNTVDCCLPADYTVTHLEALTFLLQYCLLDSSQQMSLNGGGGGGGGFQSGISSVNPGQIFNNLIHVFTPTPTLSTVELLGKEKASSSSSSAVAAGASSAGTSLSSTSSSSTTTTIIMNEQHLHAKRTALSHLPRIIASLTALWQAVLATKKNDEQATCVVGSPRVVKHQLLELLSPISFHHGVNFLAAIAVAWHERRSSSSSSSSLLNIKKVLPDVSADQQVMVNLVGSIRVIPIDTLVQTVNQVIKTPPQTYGVKQDFSLEVSILELLYVYMQSNSTQSLVESWQSLISLLKDGLSLTAPAQFLLIAILNEYIQKCPPMQEKKDIRDLQDITSKLVESCSQIAGACLEQTTWLRRNLAVREDALLSNDMVENNSGGGGDNNSIINNSSNSSNSSGGGGMYLSSSSSTTTTTPPNSVYSVQAQAILAEILAPLLDVSYGSQEKERVVTLLTNVMYNVTPYLKNHTTKNISSFIACSHLLSSLSSYQYTRKSWRKDVLDLLLDSAFFQMTPACLPYWRTIIDNLMTHDTTTFKDLMTRVSIAQSSGISIFSSKEQEYEQRAQLLKRLAFVILCSETDQYHKQMPDIQERLADSLRLPQVIPSIQAQVFLCFRVLLLRISPQHATSLWPVIVSELVQVFLHIEQELTNDSEEFRRQNSSHIKLLSGLDSSWAVNANNGLQAHGHPHWLQLQVAAAKLIDLALLLPAHKLPQFQMYRWAFVGNSVVGKSHKNNISSDFVPHITRIARLMDNKFGALTPTAVRPGELILTSNRIRSLHDLHHFFSTLNSRSNGVPLNLTQLETVIEQDFLDTMPVAPAR